MRIPEQFDDPTDITIPNHDSGSLRPHVLAPDDFATGDWARPTLLSRLGAGPFVAMGIVVGMAAALPVTAWAVHTHRWPSVGSVHATAAPMTQLCSPALPTPAPSVAPSPALDRAPAAPPPTPEAVAGSPTAVAASDASASPNEKARKKRRGLGKRAIGHPDRAKLVATDDATADARSAAVEAPLPHGAASKPASPVEDLAAAELSTSLK